MSLQYKNKGNVAMDYFVTGADGQLGFEVVREILRRGYRCTGSRFRNSGEFPCPAVKLDITDPNAVYGAISTAAPDVVIHCAAWTAVDDAEESRNRERVFAVNEGGTREIAAACRKLDCKMIYISTDYVFNGRGEDPWEADCKSFAPLNVYGQSKLAGETAVAESLQKFFIVRTAWVFGAHGDNFPSTMIRIGKNRDRVRVVNDQIGTPTYAVDLARLLVDMSETEKFGYYHATNEGGYISWYDFCCEIYRQYGINAEVVPVSTAEYGAIRVDRPLNGRLDRSKLKESGFVPLPPWQDAVRRFLEEEDL